MTYLDPNFLAKLAQQSAENTLKEDFGEYFKNFAFPSLNRGVRYQHTWAIDLMAEYANAVFRRDIKRLVINIPPRQGKSMIWSVALPSFILGHRPHEKIFSISNKIDLSTRDVAATRKLIQYKDKERAYKNIFPDVEITKDTEMHFETSAGGQRKAFTTMGGITGQGANYLIFDDFMSVTMVDSEAERRRALKFYIEGFSNRLNDEMNDVIIVVEQRLHKEDLSGYLLENKKSTFEHLCLPAEFTEKKYFHIGKFEKTVESGELLNPSRLSREILDEKKSSRVIQFDDGIERANTSQYYYAQYMQKPMAEGGNMVDMKWFQRFDLANLPEMKFDTVYVVADTAQKVKEINDPSGFLKFGVKGSCIYLLDRYNKKTIYRDTKANLLMFSAKYPAANFILVEDANTGSSLLQDLPRECSYGIVPLSHGGIKKEIRFYNATGAMANGNIFLPKEASWLFDFEESLMQFPNGSHDEDPDCLAHFLNWFKNNSVDWEKFISFF